MAAREALTNSETSEGIYLRRHSGAQIHEPESLIHEPESLQCIPVREKIKSYRTKSYNKSSQRLSFWGIIPVAIVVLAVMYVICNLLIAKYSGILRSSL